MQTSWDQSLARSKKKWKCRTSMCTRKHHTEDHLNSNHNQLLRKKLREIKIWSVQVKTSTGFQDSIKVVITGVQRREQGSSMVVNLYQVLEIKDLRSRIKCQMPLFQLTKIWEHLEKRKLSVPTVYTIDMVWQATPTLQMHLTQWGPFLNKMIILTGVSVNPALQ